ncbi:vascular-related unknown protein 1-like isoform X2 [Mangifera indica]|uniref:vascular-related unknown protein 1-like isoform X2 n=1 Tax=Mangifera indica TaxID=29780 RepID=UPI001CF9CD4A|nr:vascular-related unknown protein 1-like isoform X2 [Mangifera indica]XP_044465816.1 vascular-related unknown protein 1-like isoform X2 [Mangifera indica]
MVSLLYIINLSSEKGLSIPCKSKSINSLFLFVRLMEEDSIMNSLYTQKPKASQGTTASPEAEESGWTAYFEDISHNNEEHSYCSSCDSSSLLSDAASGVAWKLSHNNHLPACSSIRGSPKISNKLKFKKTRAKEICRDDSLEDTASSPVNDPNVGDWEPTDINPQKTDHHDHMYGSLEVAQKCIEKKEA